MMKNKKDEKKPDKVPEGWRPKMLMGGLIPTGDWLDPDNNLHDSLPDIEVSEEKEVKI